MSDVHLSLVGPKPDLMLYSCIIVKILLQMWLSIADRFLNEEYEGYESGIGACSRMYILNKVMRSTSVVPS